jgi:Mce-associated membrane protein
MTTSETENADATTGTEAASGPSRDPVRAVATALAVVAALCAVWFGWSWYDTAHSASLHYSRLRDAALSSGRQEIQNLNTLDYRTVDKNLKVWQDSSTSDLYRQITQGRTDFTTEIQQARTVTTAKVLAAAITELDEHAGKARMIAAVQITVTPPTGRPGVKQTRFIAELTRTAAGWKLSALGPAPEGMSGS